MPARSESGSAAANPWHPLRIKTFRNLLIADLVSDIGTFMQSVGAAWLMVASGACPFFVSLVQTASALPFFLLALPAGAIGDIFDRRKLILGTEIWMLTIASILAALALLGTISPWLLLLLTLSLSLGDALEAPSWRAILPELVPKEDLMAASALNGIEFNLSRAVGPALAGFIIAAAGIGTAFTLNAISFLGVLFVILRWRRPARARIAPPESVGGATVAAIRYVRHAPSILAILVRVGATMFFASAFWGLLPTVAHDLGRSSVGYGLLLGVFGTGAVLGAVVLQRTRALLSAEALLALGTIVFALVVWAASSLHLLALLCAAILFGGAAWTAVMSLLNTLVQNLAPDWVRARVLAVYMLVFQGSWAAGSAFWGFVAGRTSTHSALLASAIGVAACTLLRFGFHLPDAVADLNPWMHWGRPTTVMEPDPDDGPVLVTVEYEIAPKDSKNFLEAIYKYARVRRRDGATRWSIFYDTENPQRYLETFIVHSWAEHLRQHTRFTVADREIEEQVQRYALKTPTVHHFIYARRDSGS
jgi:MFS family permease